MKNTVRVIVYKEYEVDVSDFLPGCVRIKDFVKEEASRMFADDFINGDICPEDMEIAIVD